MFHLVGLCAGSECLEITQAQGQREREREGGRERGRGREGVLQPIYMKDEWGAGQAGWRSGGIDRDCDLLSVCVCVCVLAVCDL